VNDFFPSAAPARADVVNGARCADPHEWFTALDQRAISIGAERWLLRVVGIYEDGLDVWIQLEALGERLHEFILCVHPGMTIVHAVLAAERLIRDAGRRFR